MFNLDLLSEEVDKKGRIIGAPRSLLVIHEKAVGDGTPHVEISGDSCFYVSSERGYELYRKKMKDSDDLLYHVFERIIHRMAMDYELNNRVEKQDCRRLIFSKKMELMGMLNPLWAERTKKKIDDILISSPYYDGCSI